MDFQYMDKKLVGVNEIADYLKKYGTFSVVTVMAEIFGGMPAEKNSTGQWQITRRQIDEWMKAVHPEIEEIPKLTPLQKHKKKQKKKAAERRARARW